MTEHPVDASGSVPIDFDARGLDPVIEARAEALAGAIVGGRFQLMSILGKGGMGVVYEAIHVATRKRAAVKLILGSSGTPGDALARFTREAQATGSLNSEHIVQIFDTGNDENTQLPYIAMELLVGETLSSLSRRLGPLSEEVALRIVAHILLGLHKAHEAGVIHRDIKPANVFVVQTDSGDCVAKILDFGIAKMVNQVSKPLDGEGITATGMFLGSPRYMAPEQMLNRSTIDHRADLWSVGVVLAQLLSGQVPHVGIDSMAEIVLAVCNNEPPNVQDVAPWTPAPVAAIVQKALQRAPGDRYASAREMLDDVRAIIGESLSISARQMVPLSPERQAVVALPLAASSAPASQRGLGRDTPPALRRLVPFRSEDYALGQFVPGADGLQEQTGEHAIAIELDIKPASAFRQSAAPQQSVDRPIGAHSAAAPLAGYDPSQPLFPSPSVAPPAPSSARARTSVPNAPTSSPAHSSPAMAVSHAQAAVSAPLAAPDGKVAPVRSRSNTREDDDDAPKWGRGILTCVLVSAVTLPALSLLYSMVSAHVDGTFMASIERTPFRLGFMIAVIILISLLVGLILRERIGKVWYVPCAGVALSGAMMLAVAVGVLTTTDTVSSSVAVALLGTAAAFFFDAARSYSSSRILGVLRSAAGALCLFGALYMS
jgi:eukaryotic-like serine/threonine-protein kinase